MVFSRLSALTLFVMLFVLVALSPAPTPAQAESPPAAAAGTDLPKLVTTGWLSEHLADPDLVVLDCTVLIKMGEDGSMKAESGLAGYESGHIPTAGFADLLGDLCDPGAPREFSLPTPQQFCAAMGALGVGDDSRVVLYDGSRSVWAARVWWMLRWVGFDRAGILDGGQGAWKAAGLDLSTEPANRTAKKLTLQLRPKVIADRDEVFAAISDDAVVLVDAMPKPHYLGQMAMYGRPGHIPSAVNVPVMGLLDETGRYRPVDELAGLFDAGKTKRVITYCGGGIAASADAFVLDRLGYKDVAVYIGSLGEWAADPDNPLVVGNP